MANTTANWASVGIALVALVVSVVVGVVTYRQQSTESERRDAEIAALTMESERRDAEIQVLSEQVKAENEREQLRLLVQQVLGQRLSTRTPAAELYRFPIAEYYNATDFTQEQFLAESSLQSGRFADSFVIVDAVNWDSAILLENSAVVSVDIQAFRRLRDDDTTRACHDSTGAQSQPLLMQFVFERVAPSDEFLIVSERSAPTGPIVCSP